MPVFNGAVTVIVVCPPTATLALPNCTVAPGGPPVAVSVTLPNPALPFTLTVYVAVPPGAVVCGGEVEMEKVLPPLPTCKYGEMYWLTADPVLPLAPNAWIVSWLVLCGVPGGTVTAICGVCGLLAHRLTGAADAVAPVGSPVT